ncbi:MAG TPA: prolyl oligopeptidase family serine peptidase [Chitinolyticbacter sp.]|nr:prolyl oligopeptidase family serine peptidase [Chitinolyticbacter sp.]
MRPVTRTLTALTLGMALTHATATPIDPALGEHVEMLPVDKNLLGMKINLETTIFKPPGNGPFPLFVLTPGKDKGNPAHATRSRYTALARELVNRGYLVAVPMPRGYSQSGGSFLGRLSCEVLKPVEAQGQDIVTVTRLLSKRADVDPARVIVAGHSFGGLSMLAGAQYDDLPAKLILNFAGGMRFDDCDWQQALIGATRKLGQQGKQASVWIYSPDDPIFPEAVVEQMRQAYGPERVQYLPLPGVIGIAHLGFAMPRGFPQWWGALAPRLKTLGLPTEQTAPLPAPAPYTATGYAERGEVDKLPTHTVQGCKAKYRELMSANNLFSFAISVEGGCGWSIDADNAMASCLANSNSRSCRFYLADDQVVWPKP